MVDHTVQGLMIDNIVHGLMVLPYSAWTNEFSRKCLDSWFYNTVHGIMVDHTVHGLMIDNIVHVLMIDNIVQERTVLL